MWKLCFKMIGYVSTSCSPSVGSVPSKQSQNYQVTNGKLCEVGADTTRVDRLRPQDIFETGPSRDGIPEIERPTDQLNAALVRSNTSSTCAVRKLIVEGGPLSAGRVSQLPPHR